MKSHNSSANRSGSSSCGKCPGPVEQFDLAAGDRLLSRGCVPARDHPVPRAPNHQGGNFCGHRQTTMGSYGLSAWIMTERARVAHRAGSRWRSRPARRDRRRFGFRPSRREDKPKVPTPRMWRRITMVGVTSDVDRQPAPSRPGHSLAPPAASVGWKTLTTQGRIARIRAVAAGDATALRALPAYQRRQLVLAVLRDEPTGREGHLGSLVRSRGPDHHAIVAIIGDQVVPTTPPVPEPIQGDDKAVKVAIRGEPPRAPRRGSALVRDGQQHPRWRRPGRHRCGCPVSGRRRDGLRERGRARRHCPDRRPR